MSELNQALSQCIRCLGVKVLLLFSCLLLLFLSLRLVDVLWLVGGISQWRGTLQPSSLSIRAMKDILEQRGVAYQHAVEKSDLVHLVEKSGHVTKNGVVDLLRPPQNTEASTVTHFSCGDQFHERVMVSAEVWLAVIVASDEIHSYDADNNARIPEMSGKSWSEFQHRLSQLNIRIAILDCSKNRRWCKNRKWSTTRFQLFTRYSDSEKSNMLVRTKDVSLHHVYRWILKILQSHVTRIFTPERLQSKWLTFESGRQWPDLHVVILTDRDLLPPFVLALSAQYKGWATFVWARVACKNSLPRWTHSVDLSAEGLRFPVILAATNEGVYLYGQNSEECYSYTCLGTFLHYFKPTPKASWFASFCVAGLLSLLELVSHRPGLMQRVLMNTLIHGVVVYAIWALLAMSINRVFRFLAITKLGALVRGDIVFFVHHILVLAFSLLLAIYVMKRLTPNILGDVDEEEDDPENIIVSNFHRLKKRYQKRERQAVVEERQRHLSRERRTVEAERQQQQNGFRGRILSQQHLHRRDPRRQSRIIPINRGVLTHREPDPAPEQTEQQPNWLRNRELPLRSSYNIIRERGHLSFRYTLTPEADETLLNFISRMMESRSTATAPRHVTTDLPVWDFSSETQVPEGFRASPVCVICQDDFRQDDQMTGLPCEHVFHHACLVRWLNEGAMHACPLCRN